MGGFPQLFESLCATQSGNSYLLKSKFCSTNTPNNLGRSTTYPSRLINNVYAQTCTGTRHPAIIDMMCPTFLWHKTCRDLSMWPCDSNVELEHHPFKKDTNLPTPPLLCSMRVVLGMYISGWKPYWKWYSITCLSINLLASHNLSHFHMWSLSIRSCIL